jgi:MFS family permease
MALLLVLLVAQLMVILDITAVNIALPSVAEDLHLSGAQISWTITSYSLVFGSLLLFGGRAADLLGRRRLFLTGLGIFTVSSLASAAAGTAAALFAARAGQGLGAALLNRLRSRSSHPPSRATRRERRSPPGVRSAVRAPRSASLSAGC